MKFFTTTVALLLAAALAGCSTYPTTAEGQVDFYVERASAAISKGDGSGMAYNVQMALDRMTGDVKVNQLFATQPKGREYYLTFLNKTIADVNNSMEAGAALRKIADARGVLTAQEIASLTAKLSSAVTEGNANDTMTIKLGDDITAFPELNSPNSQQKIVTRTIKMLQASTTQTRPTQGLMQYVQRVGKDSDEGKRIATLLPTFNIRRDELDLVSQQFPEFAVARKDSMTARILLKIKNGDRFFSDDLMQAANSKIRGVEWVKDEGSKTTTVVVDRIRNDEKTIQDRTQTITYAQYEVDIVQAALFMPKNAAYIYDVITGGAEIEYGYVITAMVGGKVIHEEVVRGKAGGESSRCQNARIQNVFGGVTSAGFTANSDMQRRCSGSSSGSIDVLRQEVLVKIVDGILTVPQIKIANDVN